MIPTPVQSFACPRCGDEHPYGEPGFNWPDALFALGITEEERKHVTHPGDNEDVAVIRGACFVRSILFVPVHDWVGPVGLGLWVKLVASDFEDFIARQRVDHPSYEVAIANQATFLGPTLGLAGRLSFRGQGLRPFLELRDSTHPLVRALHDGVSGAVARAWLADTFHEGEPEPIRPRPPHEPHLDRDGYRLMTAEEAGRASVDFTMAPEPGDHVKVIVQFVAADEHGDPKPIIAGWWLELDEITPYAWSGTLMNPPRVPAPIVLGSRFWIAPEHVIEHSVAEADG